MSNWLDAAIRRRDRNPSFIAQRISLGFIEDVLEIMASKGIGQKELASMLDVSKAYVSRMFSAPPNLTLRSMAQLAVALDSDLTINILPKAVAERAWIPEAFREAFSDASDGGSKEPAANQAATSGNPIMSGNGGQSVTTFPAVLPVGAVGETSNALAV